MFHPRIIPSQSPDKADLYPCCFSTVYFYRAELCPPTCGDPTCCRDSCRMGGRREGGGQGRKKRGRQWRRMRGRVASFCWTSGGGVRKRSAETYFLSRHKQLATSCPHVDQRWFSSAWNEIVVSSAGNSWQFTHWEAREAALLSVPESSRIRINLSTKRFKKFAFQHFWQCVWMNFLSDQLHCSVSVGHCIPAYMCHFEEVISVILLCIQAVWLILLPHTDIHCQVPVCYDFPTAIHPWF